MSLVVGLSNNSYKLITNTRGFAPGFVNYKKGCTRLASTSNQVYQLFAHGRCFSPGTPAFSTTKTGRHDIAEILLKYALNTKISTTTKIKWILNGLSVIQIVIQICSYSSSIHLI